MGLEEKFGETLGGLPFLDTALIAPQTVSDVRPGKGHREMATYLASAFFVQMTAQNMFDSYGMMGAGGPSTVGQGGVMSGSPNPPMLLPQMSASCPNTMDDHGMMHGLWILSLLHVLHFPPSRPPSAPPLDIKMVEKERQKKNNHNMSKAEGDH